MTSESQPDRYPGARTLSEAQRLHAQHTLLVDVLGGLILFRDEVLTDPNSAYLVGTDVKAYHGTLPNIEFRAHDFRTPFPEEWKGSFDLAQMRNCLGSTGTDEAAIEVITRLLELVEPGTGWIQLVDGAMTAGPINETDNPWLKLSKTIGNIMLNAGLDSSLGSRVATFLAKASGDSIIDFESRTASSPIGKGYKAEMEEIGCAEISGLVETIAGSLGMMENPPMTAEEFRGVGEECFGEAREVGVEMPWFAAWAMRV